MSCCTRFSPWMEPKSPDQDGSRRCLDAGTSVPVWARRCTFTPRRRLLNTHREHQSTETRVALTVPDKVNSAVLWSNSEPGTVGSNFDMY